MNMKISLVGRSKGVLISSMVINDDGEVVNVTRTQMILEQILY